MPGGSRIDKPGGRRIDNDDRPIVCTVARLLVVLAVASAAGGCVHYQHTPYDPEAAAEAPEPDVAELFRYDRDRVAFNNDVVEDDADASYDIRHVKLASIGDNGQPGNLVRADYYRQRGRDDQRLMIVLPIWGRDEIYPPKRIAEGIARRLPDVNVLRVRGPDRLMDWDRLAAAESEAEFDALYERYAERFRINVLDVRRLIDWAQQQPEIDGERVGVAGFSIGAIAAAVVAANEPRLRLGVIGMGAVEPARVLAECGGRRGEAREIIMERFGWDVGDYRDAVADYFAELDASVDGSWPDPRRLLVIDARFDRCMSREVQDELWRRLGRPERISISGGHRTAFLSMTFIGFYFVNHWIYDFVDEYL